MKRSYASVCIQIACALFPFAISRASAELIVDPHIKIVDYDAGRVTSIHAAQGYAIVVELGAEEHIDSVVVGDSAAWQVTSNKRADHVIVKPLPTATATDMVVVTGTRTFVFLLDLSGDGAGAPFVVRFRYPQTPVPVSTPALAAYRFRGTRALFPVAMYDDGRHTTITWGRDVSLPAVYAIDADRKERIVNGQFRGADYVLDEIAPLFVFRLDKRSASAGRQPLGRSR